MRVSHSFVVQIDADTFIDFYDHGNKQICFLDKSGVLLSIAFDTNCLNKIPDLIYQLEKLQNQLLQEKQNQLSQEIAKFNLSRSFLTACNANEEENLELEIGF